MSKIQTVNDGSAKLYSKMIVAALFCIVCILMLSIASDSSEASVGDEFTIDGITYNVANEGSSNEVTVVHVDDSVTEYSGTGTVTNNGITYNVTIIAASVFRDHLSLTTVHIPDTVKYIGQDAFRACSSLSTLTLGKLVFHIGNNAFFECTSIKSLIVPVGVTHIGVSAFENLTSITSLIIEGDIRDIQDDAFDGCVALKELTIPISIDAANSIFDGCSNIEKIVLTAGSGRGYDYGTWTPGGGSNYANTPWRSSNLKLREVVLEEGIEYIGSFTLSGCTNITSLTVPDSVSAFGNNAFGSCTGLKEVTLPISANVASDTDSLFSGCNNIGKITLTRGNGNGYDYSNVDSKNSNNYYKNTPWYKLKDTSTIVVLEEGIRSIGKYTFAETIRGQLIIPESVEFIGEGAFFNCQGITELTLPISANPIGDNWCPAFYRCINISKITLTAGTGKGFDYSIGIDKNNDYCLHTPWYINQSSLKTVVLSEGIVSIGMFTFFGNKALTSITIPSTVISIYPSSFDLCTSLKSVSMSGSLKFIGNNAFSQCTSLTSIELPDGVTYIGDYAFRRCTSLRTLYIPDSVTDIGMFAFRGCSNISWLYLSANLTKLGGLTFASEFIIDGKSVGTDDLSKIVGKVWVGSGVYDGKRGTDSGAELYPLGVGKEIKFDANGGISTSELMSTVDGHLKSLPMASKNGSKFLGWWTEKVGGTKVDLKTKLVKNCTLYAHWSDSETDDASHVTDGACMEHPIRFAIEATVKPVIAF